MNAFSDKLKENVAHAAPTVGYYSSTLVSVLSKLGIPVTRQKDSKNDKIRTKDVSNFETNFSFIR